MEILIGYDKSGLSMRRIVVFFCIVFILGLVLVSGCTSAPPTITAPQTPVITPTQVSSESMSALLFVTEDYPPYNYIINGSPKGISVDLLRAMAGKLNFTIVDQKIWVMPWAVSYQVTLERNNTVLFSTVRLPERENLFKWVGPIGTSQKVIFAKKDRVINISSPTDLKQYKIGYINGDAAQAQLKALGIPDNNIVPYSNISYLITGAQQNNIDLWCFGDLAGRYFAQQVIGDTNAFTPVYTLDKYDLYYAFNKDIPDATVKSFQDALDVIRTQPDQSGITEYQRIIVRNSLF